MTVTPLSRRPRRRPPRAEIEALEALPTKVAQVRYACEHMPAPATTSTVRAWLAERGVDVRREHCSNTLNAWRRENGQPVTPPSGLSLASIADQMTSDSELTMPPTDTLNVTPPATVQDTPPAGPELVTHVSEITTEHALITPPVATAELAPESTGQVTPSARPEITPQVTPAVAPAVAPEPSPALLRRSKRLRAASYVVLTLVAAAGAALSYQSLEKAAANVFPTTLAYMFPLLVDALIVGASLAYLAGATVGRGRPGWRLTAHAAVAGTLFLNALAAATVGAVPWHIAAPLVWSVIVELTARDLLGDHRLTVARPDSIPFALWLTAPGESASTWLRVRRQAAHASARLDVGAHAAAREALRMALPGLSGRRARRIIGRQLRAGSITPDAVLTQAVSIMGDLRPGSPKAVLRDVLAAAVSHPKGVAPTS